jgi:carbon-monoxide dehydrogenase small subunit
MIVKFILNGEDVTVRAAADTRLIDLLRNTFSMTGARMGCLSGRCGACFVLLDWKAVPSCMIPIFSVRNREILTIEGFSQTEEYYDIIEGFKQAQADGCGFCETGIILAAEALLERVPRPSREEILSAFTGVKCRCTEPESLVNGVLAAAEKRQRRLYGRSA